MPRKGNDDEESISSDRFQPLKTFESLMGEGEKFCRDQLYHKAIECYTEVNWSNTQIFNRRFAQQTLLL